MNVEGGMCAKTGDQDKPGLSAEPPAGKPQDGGIVGYICTFDHF